MRKILKKLPLIFILFLSIFLGILGIISSDTIIIVAAIVVSTEVISNFIT